MKVYDRFQKTEIITNAIFVHAIRYKEKRGAFPEVFYLTSDEIDRVRDELAASDYNHLEEQEAGISSVVRIYDTPIVKINDNWNELYGEARANLDMDQLDEFYIYRDQLISEGHEWEDDAECILRGFIWDEIEGQ